MTKYETLANRLREQIEKGVWNVGDKLPSLRKQSEQVSMSLMTVMQAYQMLESQGWITSQERSGYIVSPKIGVSVKSVVKYQRDTPENVDINDFIFSVLQSSRDQKLINFGSVYPDSYLYPKNQVNRALTAAVSDMPASSALDNLPPGNCELRQIISKRYAAQGINISPDELIITAGALEALNLSLQAVTDPGDLVIVESPVFYGALQALQRLNLRALSINTTTDEGIDLDELKEALRKHKVKACWLMTNHQNPTGFTLPVHKKQRLVSLLNEYDVQLIEDDVNNELYSGSHKPLPAKAFDTESRVMHCASFSKSLIAGYRIGWVAAGRHALKIQKLQLMSTLSVSAPIQLAFSKYLTTRNYEKHLRILRRTLAQRKYAMWKLMQLYFPASVTVHYSEGGYFLWVEMPSQIDATILYEQALSKNIGIAPGKMFAPNNTFNHCFRLNASFECNSRVEDAIKTLGVLISDQLTQQANSKSV